MKTLTLAREGHPTQKYFSAKVAGNPLDDMGIRRIEHWVAYAAKNDMEIEFKNKRQDVTA